MASAWAYDESEVGAGFFLNRLVEHEIPRDDGQSLG